ncbi:hypothetical protein BH11BAC5_BH11BAC5_30630 [soil metagenome]
MDRRSKDRRNKKQTHCASLRNDGRRQDQELEIYKKVILVTR